ncbi:hypothetical protein WMY93_030479 [Mugilogobius chulae]|uniref:C1q domain-containing protein n=1 Tax=Mugilogobius chulae TaxID=88201 RepID=A0AAW0MQ70_9GOBI
MEQLKAENQAQAAILRKLDPLVQQQQQMKENLKAQQVELNALTISSTVTESKLETLVQDKKVQQVAFSAALLDSVSNIGNCYNKNTGIFTAPVRGVYHFEIFALSNGNSAVDAYLKKNGQGVFMAHEDTTSGHGTGGNAVTLLLEPGDVIYVTLPPNRQLYDNQNHHNTFSGHLLFTVDRTTQNEGLGLRFLEAFLQKHYTTGTQSKAFSRFHYVYLLHLAIAVICVHSSPGLHLHITPVSISNQSSSEGWLDGPRVPFCYNTLLLTDASVVLKDG